MILLSLEVDAQLDNWQEIPTLGLMHQQIRLQVHKMRAEQCVDVGGGEEIEERELIEHGGDDS